jgi:predicted dienelactone hydrolase
MKQIYPLILAAGVAIAIQTVAPAPGALAEPAEKRLVRASVQPVSLTFEDKARARSLPAKIYLPAGSTPAPVILFSHGLGGDTDTAVYLMKRWQAEGFAVVALQHPGSDASVWKGKRPAQARRDAKKAASGENLVLRLDDVSFMISALETLQKEDPRFTGRFDLKRIGVSGHSFGARTAQGIGGQVLPHVGTAYTDPRVKAALMLSPSSASGRGLSPADQFGGVTIPWMLMTGTKDTAPIGGETLEDRLAVFPALPAGGKYELVLDGAEHHAFTDRPLGKGKAARDPDHHGDIEQLSTAFWAAHLKGDAESKAWLAGEGPRSILDVKDSWKVK